MLSHKITGARSLKMIGIWTLIGIWHLRQLWLNYDTCNTLGTLIAIIFIGHTPIFTIQYYPNCNDFRTVHLKHVHVDGLQVELALGPSQEDHHVVAAPDPGVRSEAGGQLALVVQQRGGRGLRGHGREAQRVSPQQFRTKGEWQRQSVHGWSGRDRRQGSGYQFHNFALSLNCKRQFRQSQVLVETSKRSRSLLLLSLPLRWRVRKLTRLQGCLRYNNSNARYFPIRRQTWKENRSFELAKQKSWETQTLAPFRRIV